MVLEQLWCLSKFAARKGENDKHVVRWWDADVQAEYISRCRAVCSLLQYVSVNIYAARIWTNRQSRTEAARLSRL